jgi:hypothetical protein
MLVVKALAIAAGIVSCVFTVPAYAHHHCPGNVTDPLCTPFGATEQQEDRGGVIRGSGR